MRGQEDEMTEIEVLQAQVDRLKEVVEIQQSSIELIISTQDSILRSLASLAVLAERNGQ